MERSLAQEFLALARTVASNITHDEAEAIWRSFVARYAFDALSALGARDAMLDPVGAKALALMEHVCPSCYVDKTRNAHRPDCVYGE